MAFGPLFPKANNFSWVGIGFIQETDYKKPNPTKILRKHTVFYPAAFFVLLPKPLPVSDHFLPLCASAQAPPVTHTVQHTPSPLNGVVTEQLAGTMIEKFEEAGDEDRGGKRTKSLFKPRSLGSADAS